MLKIFTVLGIVVLCACSKGESGEEQTVEEPEVEVIEAEDVVVHEEESKKEVITDDVEPELSAGDWKDEQGRVWFVAGGRSSRPMDKNCYREGFRIPNIKELENIAPPEMVLKSYPLAWHIDAKYFPPALEDSYYKVYSIEKSKEVKMYYGSDAGVYCVKE